MAEPIKTRKVTSSIFLPDDQTPVSELPDKLRIIRDFVADPTATDCRKFTEKMELWREKELYKHFADTWEQFCRDNFNQPLEWIEHVMQGVRLLEGKDSVTAQEAYDASVRAKQLAENPDREINQGKRTDLIEHHNHNNEVERVRQGSDPQYLAARIARDRPDIQEAMKEGKYKSVRAAAVDAGIVKPRMQFTVGESTTPQVFAASLYEKLKPDFLAELVAALTDVLTTSEPEDSDHE